MAKYNVFAYDHHYPCGASKDFRFATDDLDEARKKRLELETDRYDNVEIMDTDTGKVVR